ncbi:hypothetical protein HCJ66_10275 [Listeria sp. FSL L7-1582]|uniref:T7SS effector LXG polymorphic toxin n=1 Tax=Listeria portnoyi TaxID=2713504 RepID=UPI00164CFA2C|nr:T7SS effector LXG polymorphic toxin [Listeria portnoyi]MBC6309927.1 hypothetical protein [Listeria portnoyi]
MSVNMFLGSADEQATAIGNVCQAQISEMEKVKEAITQFTAETALKGQAYDSAKQYFEATYVPLANGFILIAEALQKAAKQLAEEYRAEVDGNSLQEDALRNQIRQLGDLIEESNMCFAPSATALVGTGISANPFLPFYEDQKREIQEKLDKLMAYDGKSATLITEVASLMTSVETGLREVGSGKGFNASTGSFSILNLNMNWADAVSGVFSSGEYGGNQGSPSYTLKNGDTEIKKILKNHFPDMTEKEMKDYLDKLNDEGCGYVALVNGFLDQYGGTEREFEKEFGFPMYTKKDNGEKTLNYNYLLVDLYASEDNHNKKGIWFWSHDELDEDEDASDIDGYGTTQESREYRFNRYLDKHDMEVEFKNGVPPSISNYDKYSDNDEEIILSMSPVILENKSGDVVENMQGGHAVSVTGKTDDGRLIVSSWGTKYYVSVDSNEYERLEMQVVTYD